FAFQLSFFSLLCCSGHRPGLRFLPRPHLEERPRPNQQDRSSLGSPRPSRPPRNRRLVRELRGRRLRPSPRRLSLFLKPRPNIRQASSSQASSSPDRLVSPPLVSPR